jgi:hypothetical protein
MSTPVLNVQEELHKYLQDWQETVKTFSARAARLEQAIQAQSKEMESAKAKYVELQNKMNQPRKDLKDKIRLNIGGTIFVTSLDTMMLEQNTFFSAMFSEEFHQQPDQDGEYYVDRDPAYFPIILNHMRGVDVKKKLAGLHLWEKSLIQQEVEFYQIESMKSLVGLVKKARYVGADDRTIKKNLVKSSSFTMSLQCSAFVDSVTGKAYLGRNYTSQQLYEYESLEELMTNQLGGRLISLSGGYKATYLCAHDGFIYAAVDANTIGKFSAEDGKMIVKAVIPGSNSGGLNWGGKCIRSAF